MTKTIKFNLILDGKPVRDLEGLQNNYNIDDIFSNYRSGILERWLEVREYRDHLSKIKGLKAVDEISLARELAKIFEVYPSDEETKKSLYALQFRKDEKSSLENIEKAKFNHNEVVSKYHSGYESLQFEIIKRRKDFSYVKQAVKEIYNKYFRLFQLNYMDFYYKMMKNEAPLAIFAVLMHENLREYYLPKDNIEGDLLKIFNEKIKKLLRIEYSTTLSNFFVDGETKNLCLDEDCYLKEYFKMFAGETEGYWKDIKSKTVKTMIIHIHSGNFVRSAGKNGEEYKPDDINGKFVIMDGIDYKSNNANHKLIYMEV